jgi:hypothetical protein
VGDNQANDVSQQEGYLDSVFAHSLGLSLAYFFLRSSALTIALISANSSTLNRRNAS